MWALLGDIVDICEQVLRLIGVLIFGGVVLLVCGVLLTGCLSLMASGIADIIG